MKKNLNIAYLNGAEGMIRRGGASSGGNGESGGDASTIEYWSMNWDIYNSLESNLKEIILTSTILGTSELAKIAINENVEIKNSGTILYMHMYTNGGIPYSIMAISYNKMVDITADGDRQKSFEELLLEMEAQVEGITDCFSRITKEQFYSLEIPTPFLNNNINH